MPINKPNYDEIRRFGKTFTTVLNDSIEGLSAESIATFVYLQSKPVDWVIRVSEVRKRFGFGDHTWRKISKELRDKGLLFDWLERDSRGKVVAKVLCMGSEPLESIPLNTDDMGLSIPSSSDDLGPSIPLTSHVVVQPRRCSPTDLLNKDYLQKKEKIQKADKSAEPKTSKTDDPGFTEFWNVYGHKVKKQNAIRMWNKLKEPDRVHALSYVASKPFKSWRLKQFKPSGECFLPHPSTWLNDRRWEDDIPVDNETSEWSKWREQS